VERIKLGKKRRESKLYFLRVRLRLFFLFQIRPHRSRRHLLCTLHSDCLTSFRFIFRKLSTFQYARSRFRLCLPPFLLVYFTFALAFAFACVWLFFCWFLICVVYAGLFQLFVSLLQLFLMRIFTNQPTKNNEYISYNSGFLLLKVNTYVVVERNASNCN